MANHKAFDFKESWFDDENKPLAGKVEFCKLHTTELENIYDNQGYPCNNPMYTNTIGQLDTQVFMKDKTDYTVRFYKYIGVSDMTEDQDNWLFLYSADVFWDTYNIVVDTNALQTVNTIAGLRSLNPDEVQVRDGIKIVSLAGYYQVGDKPAVQYEWDPDSLDSDNGGSVIQVTGIETGRWHLVNNFNCVDGFDVRHFGVFGSESISEASDEMSYAIGYANDYAYQHELPLYFPSINSQLTWYKMNNLIINGALFQENTRVIGNTGTTSTITVYDENTHLDVWTNQNYNGVFHIAGRVVRTYWGVDTGNCYFEPDFKLIIDSPVNTSNRDWKNIVVEIQNDITNAQFDGCEILGDGHIGNYCTLKNMRVTQRMFKVGVNLDTITVFDSDTIDIDDFPSTAVWFSLVLQNSGRSFDFKGRALDASCENNTTSAIIYKNAYFNGYTIKQTDVNLEYCNGSAILGTLPRNINVANSADLTLGGSTVALNSLNVRSGVVRFGRDMTITSVGLSDNSIYDDGSYTLYATTFAANDSVMRATLSGTNISASRTIFMNGITAKVPQFTECTFYGTIFQNETTLNTINFYFIGCNFYGGNGHMISAGIPNTLVVGSWLNNYSTLNNHFISIDRTNIDLDESHHTYKYDGNRGPNVLQRLEAKWNDVVYLGPSYPGTSDALGCSLSKVLYTAFTAGTNTEQVAWLGYRGRMFRDSQGIGGTTDPDYYLSMFSMFTVGTRNVGTLVVSMSMPHAITPDMYLDGDGTRLYNIPYNLETVVGGGSISETERPWFSSPVGWPKGLAFVEGYTWKVLACEGIIGIPVAWHWWNDSNWCLPVTYTITAGPRHS